MTAATDVAGELRIQVSEEHAYFDASGLAAVLVEQRLAPGVKYAGWMSVPSALLKDAAAMAGVVGRIIDRHLRPWAHPDPNPMPRIRLFRWLPR